MASEKFLQLSLIVLLGLLYGYTRCDARAVNVSNTWTMPQEGLNVFYRFFRDRISWFEADAVCQFHHANLVTVDNSFQFDATRDLLRELDVNDIVWIGLMRPQSSERFMWSNSRPLVTDTGYWAESLPLMDAPLCAVIDPIRDYRWHALRCGGPETASFLCEMPVPSWADACILRDMPNLTMQYMADTASIELIRNCEEEGLLRQTCKGKQDRERAIHDLICPKERLEAQRINDITNSHFKSLQIINSIQTDNNENNDIELLPFGQNYGLNNEFAEQIEPTEKNTVQRLIEQFNVDELMQADQPAAQGHSLSGFKIPGEIPKPVKKAAKKVLAQDKFPKKDKTQVIVIESERKEIKPQVLSLDDMMMGDQPMGEPEMPEPGPNNDNDVSNEIMSPLPHRKKILPQDLKTMAPITENPTERYDREEKQREKEAEVKRTEEKLKAMITTSTTSTTAVPTTTTTTSTTTVPPSTTITATTEIAKTSPPSSTESSTLKSDEVATPTSEVVASSSSATTANIIISSTNSYPTTTTQTPQTTISMTTSSSSAPTVGHPMHPQQQRTAIITEESQHPHIKESTDNSHFIPPMLLVKSHYVPMHHEHHENHENHANQELVETETSTAPTTTPKSDNPTTTGESIKAEQKMPMTSSADESSTQGIETTPAAAADALTTTSTTAAVATPEPVAEETLAKIIDDGSARDFNQVVNSEGHKEATVITATATTPTTPTGAIANQMENNKTKVEQVLRVNAPATTNALAEKTSSSSSSSTTTAKTNEPEPSPTTEAADADTTTKPTPINVGVDQGGKESKLENVATTKIIEAAETSTTRVHDESGAFTVTTNAPIAAASSSIATAATTGTTTTTTESPRTSTKTTVGTSSLPPSSTTTATPSTTTTETSTFAPATRNFLNDDDTEATYRPNRRRSLTKPETVSYLKKILG